MGPEARSLNLIVRTDSSSGVKRKGVVLTSHSSSRDELRMEMKLYFCLAAYTLSLHWHVRRSTLRHGPDQQSHLTQTSSNAVNSVTSDSAECCNSQQ